MGRFLLFMLGFFEFWIGKMFMDLGLAMGNEMWILRMNKNPIRMEHQAHPVHSPAQTDHFSGQELDFGPDSPLQRAANSSEQVRQLMQLQAAANASAQVAEAGKVQAAANGAPMQLKKIHVQTWLKKNDPDGSQTGLKEVSYAKVKSFVEDGTKDAELRRTVLKEWNKGSVSNWLIPLPDDLRKTGTLPLGGNVDPVSGTESPFLGQMDYFSSLDQLKGSVSLGTKDDSLPQNVPLVDSFPDGVRMTRLYGHAFQGSTEPDSRLFGPQFIVQHGSNFGLFDAPRGNDLVFSNLKKEEAMDEGGSGSTMYRESSIASWPKIARLLKEEFTDMAQLKSDLLNILMGKLTSENMVLNEAAGAIACDAKTSVQGWEWYVKQLEMTTETDPEKWFYSAKESQNPVYLPSIEGGRKLPGLKKEDLKMEEKEESSEESDVETEIVEEDSMVLE